MNEQEYRNLMCEWATEVREWTGKHDATFFKDGIFNQEAWDKSEIKLLFVLKEVHEKTKGASEPSAYGIENSIDFVSTENGGSDPYKGEEAMWKRVGILANAIFKMKTNPSAIPQYEELQKEMQDNNNHKKTCDRIAVINLKKLAGGNYADSKESKATLCFECHATKFYDKLIKQIDLIDPTIIICCGKNSVIESLGLKKEDTVINIGEKKIPIINAFHPQQTSTDNFYYSTLEKVRDIL